jgi:chromosome segregation ATPase
MKRLACIVQSVLVIAVVTSASAQQAPGNEPLVAAVVELARLNATLERIADMLVRQTKLDMLARRIELAGTRIADAEKRLAAVESERTGLDAEQRRLEQILEHLREQAASAGDDEAAREIAAQLKQVEAELARMTSRLRALADEAVEAEARLTRQRVDLEEWQAYLDRMISAL